MINFRPFSPVRGANQVVDVSTTSDNITIYKGSKSVRFVNSGDVGCYVKVGSGGVVATTSDTFVGANDSILIYKLESDDVIAYITDSGDTTLNIQPGEFGKTKGDVNVPVSVPSGYTVSLEYPAYFQGTPNDPVSFTFADAEVGSTYNYTISSDGGGTDVTGSGTISTATDTISGIDISGLSAGELTLSVTLTNAGGEGDPATDTAQIAEGGVAWFDFPDASTVTEVSGKVSQIDSKLGTSINASQSVGGLRPIYATNAVNSLNVAGFRITGDLITRYLDTTSNIVLADVSTISYTVYAVVFPQVASMQQDLARVFENDSSFDEATFTSYNSNAGWRIRTRGESIVSNTDLTDSQINIITAKLSGTTVDLYKNEDAIATGSASGLDIPIVAASYRIGEGITGSSRGWGGYIGEIVMFNKAHSDTVRQAVVSRLMNKWGVS